jgi:hypothetical protein
VPELTKYALRRVKHLQTSLAHRATRTRTRSVRRLQRALGGFLVLTERANTSTETRKGPRRSPIWCWVAIPMTLTQPVPASLSLLSCTHHVPGCEHSARTQKKWEPPLPTRVGKKKKRGPDPSQKRKSRSLT